MKQYAEVKSKYPDAILLFRVGDFYETFGEDAVSAADILGIVLTSRNNGGSDVELAGFPHHSLDTYLPKLVRAGHRVAICEQLEKPSPQKKIVKRGVTDLVTPGLVISDQVLEQKTNHFLASLSLGRKGKAGIAFLDLSTGEFLISEGTHQEVEKLMQSFKPAETLLSKGEKKYWKERLGEDFYQYPLDEWVFTADFTREKLLDHFQVESLKGFGVEDLELGQIAAGAILHYLETTEHHRSEHISSISRIQSDKYVWLDRFTIRNLELLSGPYGSSATLLRVLDKTVSPMGGRLMRKWVIFPLVSIEDIEKRQEAVAYFLDLPAQAREVEQSIQQMGDLERLISRIAMQKANPREVRQLARALEALIPLKSWLESAENVYLNHLGQQLDLCTSARERIEQSLVPEPPVNLSKGGVVADGVSERLDELRYVVKNSKGLLSDIVARESQRTGIKSLKYGFNNVFGFYLEVTNKHKQQVPEEWIRKQTLTNAERYITEELKELEAKILGAEEEILLLEDELYGGLIRELSAYIVPVQQNARQIATLDCLLSFAKVAGRQQYCCPEMHAGSSLEILEGRHPVIEQQLALGEAFVPNDVFLDSDKYQVLMITGPNMSGKSALLRQTALICLMAQMGSFVPAKVARLGIVDKVFTRVGASDNIASGESTFMVEMNETASIMNNISDRSLILLDEIGRGTSTYDGISIAWSIAEYLHNNGLYRPKTLFATHYHELNELAGKLDRIHNFHVSTREANGKVIFLRKLVSGGSEHSFGIHVARMAGMPRSIVERAAHILTQMEQKHLEGEGSSPVSVKAPFTEAIKPSSMQLSIFETVDPLAGKLKEALKEANLNSMTPIECMLKIQEWQNWLEEEG